MVVGGGDGTRTVAVDVCGFTPVCTDKGASTSHTTERACHKGGGDGTRTVAVDVCGFTPVCTDKGVPTSLTTERACHKGGSDGTRTVAVDVCGVTPVCTDKGASTSHTTEHVIKEVVMVRGPFRWMSVASHLCAQTKECPCHNRASMTKRR